MVDSLVSVLVYDVAMNANKFWRSRATVLGLLGEEKDRI
jgi:hypothetical protein